MKVTNKSLEDFKSSDDLNRYTGEVMFRGKKKQVAKMKKKYEKDMVNLAKPYFK